MSGANLRSHTVSTFLIGTLAGFAPVKTGLSQKPPPLVAKDSALPAYRLRLLGVYDAETGNGIQNAEVVDLATGASGTTNRSGLVSLAFLRDGGGMVRVRKIGYTPVTRFLAISPTDTAAVTEILSPEVPTLPAVTTRDDKPKYISPGLRGFEERRAQGFGRFITEAELRKHDNDPLGQIIGILPGLRTVQTGRSILVVSTRGGSPSGAFRGANKPCPVTVYVDGVRIYSATDPKLPPPDFADLKTNEYAGVEFYAGGASIPVQLNATDSGCGTLLLWTRVR